VCDLYLLHLRKKKALQQLKLQGFYYILIYLTQLFRPRTVIAIMPARYRTPKIPNAAAMIIVLLSNVRIDAQTLSELIICVSSQNASIFINKTSELFSILHKT